MRRNPIPYLSSLILAAALFACGDDSGSGGPDDGSNNGGDGGSVWGDGGPPASGECGDGVSQCTDGMDNDGDGMIDAADVECTGPCDRDESSFATGLPGDNRDPNWQDCFFDGDSGAGNDGCRYNTCCLYGTCSQADLDRGYCDVSEECQMTCGPATPAGCDCFGCCHFCDSEGCVDVVPLPTCQFENLRDAETCPVCTPTTDCGAECDPANCILCPGQDPADLPPECNGSTSCPDGTSPCDPDGGCGAGEYCEAGCCLVQIP